MIGETEFAGRPAIVIDRTEKTLSTAEGSENQHRIVIRNEGTGAAKIYVDRMSGALLSSDSEQHSDVIVTAGRARQFKQLVKENTTAEKLIQD
ncbi:MAG: hypothetical protein ABI556_00085 [Gemmatimonadales bacterium]